jgi:NADPH:quinone reductase-like Zn-dependent oxidoreductase
MSYKQKMKVVICTKYGAPKEVIKMVEVEKPTPKDNEVLIKNYATTVTVADCRVRGFDVPASFWLPARLALGLTKPRTSVLGGELSGVIESIGKSVTKFKVGDNVFAFTSQELGAYAEYVCVKENGCISINPENLSFEQSAALSFGGTTALHFLQKGKVTQSDKVLIYGASGSVGTYAVQLAKYFGAEVTGICSAANMELVKNIGADKVIDYTSSDWAGFSETFDVFFDVVGKCSLSKAISMIKPQGRYLHAVATPFTEIKIKRKLSKKNIAFIGGTFKATSEQMAFIKQLTEKGFVKPVIDRQYKLDEIATAHEYVDKGHKKGNVVIRI